MSFPFQVAHTGPTKFSRINVSRATMPGIFGVLMWQTHRFFDLAELCKHPFILLSDRVSFLCAAKLDHISMRTMKDEKRIRGVRPAPMLHVVSELLGSWHRSPHLVIRDVRGVVHHVGDVRGSYAIICIRIHIGPEDGREHVRDAGSFRRFVIARAVTFLDDLFHSFVWSPLSLHLRPVTQDPTL